MAQKQITDLALATSFDAGDLLLLRKTGEGVDKAITQQTFIETLGNPSVTGFTATSPGVNQVVLTPANDVVIDKYYNGMVVSFISPITSTGGVTIKIGTLTFRTLQEIGTSTTSTLTTGKFYDAVFIGTAGAGTFFQTNIVTPYIFTNEYTAVGAVIPGTSTTYALTTAIGASKATTGYYNGMSALFTVDVDSQGAVILNIDGLGNKQLLDPVGDAVPFDLVANEAIFAIYDGTSFRKRMFSDLEPEPPLPTDKIVTVGLAGSGANYTTIDAALTQLIKDYGTGEKSFSGTIQLLAGFVQTSALLIRFNTPWITIKTAAGGNNVYGFGLSGEGNINFQGIFNHVLNGTSNPSFLTIDSRTSDPKCTFTSSSINCLNTNDNIKTTCIEFITNESSGSRSPTTFLSVNINGFHVLYSTVQGILNRNSSNFKYNGGSVNMRSTGTEGQSNYVIYSGGDYDIRNVAFGNINRTVNIIFYIAKGGGTMENVTITKGGTGIIYSYTGITTNTSYLINCSFRKTDLTSGEAVNTDSNLIINGGDYTRTLPNTTLTDIKAQAFPSAIITILGGATGVKQAIPPGQIV